MRNNIVMLFATIMLLDGCWSAYMSALPRYTPRMEKGVYPKMPPVERHTFYYYFIYVYGDSLLPGRFISGVSDNPIKLDVGSKDIRNFATRFYQKAFCAPYGVYSAHSSMYSRHFNDQEMENIISREDRLYMDSKIFENTNEYRFPLKDSTRIIVKNCIVDGYFWKCKGNERKIGMTTADYLSICRDIKVRNTSYVIKSLISAKRPK
mgnify:CR=1 FL=1